MACLYEKSAAYCFPDGLWTESIWAQNTYTDNMYRYSPKVEAIEYSLIGSWVSAVEFNVTDYCVFRLRHEMRWYSSPICLYILDNKKPLGNYDTLRADNISSTVHKQDDYHRWIWRAIKVFERFNIALRLRGRYTLSLGRGHCRKSIYVNPLGKTRRA